MNLDFFKTNYPTSFFANFPDEPNNFFYLQIQQQLLAIPLADLSSSEITLLQHLQTNVIQEKAFSTDNPWYQFLFLKGPSPEKSGNFRIIHFLHEPVKGDQLQPNNWETALKDMFPCMVSSFYPSPNYSLLVEKKEDYHYVADEIEGILKTLEDDFGTRVKVFLGNFIAITDHFTEIFIEQSDLFLSNEKQINTNQVISYTDIALDNLTKEATKKSPTFNYYAEKVTSEPEIQSIILALWQNQGNISSTAKDLFMHRNTLRYRIEKFSEQTSIALKTMDDLVLAYLFVKQK